MGVSRSIELVNLLAAIHILYSYETIQRTLKMFGAHTLDMP